MAVTRKVYLLTVLMIVITLLFSFAWHYYEVWNSMIQREHQATESLTYLLELELGGKSYEELLGEEISTPNHDQVLALNRLLQPIVEKVQQAFPGYGAGYYVKDLQSIVAFVPNYDESGLKDIRPQSEARTVYQTKEPYKFHNYSQTRGAYVIARIHPIIIDGEVIGHVWGNITVSDFRTLFMDRIDNIFSILIPMLIMGLIGTKFITLKYEDSIKLFRDRVCNLDLDYEDSPHFLPEMMEIYQLVQSSHLQLAASEKRFRDVVSAFDEYVWESGRDGEYIYLSEPVERIIGFTPDELRGKSLNDNIHHDDLSTVKQVIAESIQEKQGFQQLQYRRQKKDGSWVWLQTSAVIIVDEQGDFLGFRGAARDISEEIKNKELIYHLAYTDPLTQLPNRSKLYEVLDAWIEEGELRGTKFALLFIDMDRFKVINDSLGHEIGDQVLVAAAQRISSQLGLVDELYRLGGDEFIALLPIPCDHTCVEAKVDKIIHSFTQPLQLNGRSLYSSVSVGISFYPDDGRDRTTLIRNSDSAMYDAKAKGRNQFRKYHHVLNQQVTRTLQLENELRNALKLKQFTLHYQPQVDVMTREVIGVEALLRWEHPRHGWIPPNQFIPLAEETGIIIPLGEWVLREACKQMVNWLEAGIHPIKLGVNISAVQFQQNNFVILLEEIIQETGIPAELLELEITERVAMDQIEQVMETMGGLKQLGVNIAIDDFGTGFSSLNYLSKFPISRLKIDQMFIRHVNMNPEDNAIVNSIIALAHTLNLQVVAEGVEEDKQWSYLSQQRCDYIQGYLVSKPVPPEQLLQLLQNRSL